MTGWAWASSTISTDWLPTVALWAGIVHVRTDVLERDVAPVRVAGGQVELDLRPFELATLKLHVTP